MMTGGSAAWLDEGLACVFADQEYKDAKTTKQQIKKMLRCYFDFDRSLFGASWACVNGLVDHFGKKSVITFLRGQKNQPRNPDEFARSFKKHFGIDYSIDGVLSVIRNK
jgi:hypothetical protein